MSEHKTESNYEAERRGYDAALDDVREAINESLNLAHLREALRYLHYSPGELTP